MTHNASATFHFAERAENGAGASTAVAEEMRQLIDIWVAPLLVRKFLSDAYSKGASFDAENRNDIDGGSTRLFPTSKPE